MVVVPYLHQLSHNLKQVVGRYGIPVVFSAPQKMSQVCARVSAGAEKCPQAKCTKKHQKPFVTCTSDVVYRIPPSCRRSYVGQTGRCLNDRLREHAYSLRATVRGLLPLHCRDCSCLPSFGDVVLVSRHRDKMTREIIEAFFISSLADRCVSEPSVALSEREILYLQSKMSVPL